jgi:hypothetical protein
MAAATAGYEWNRSSPLRSSPDTSSSMYPDRPIRPLPRRSLRARLSPEQVGTIVYPHNPPSSGPLFNYPYSTSERGSRSLRTGESDHHACHCGHTHSEVESEEEEDERGAPIPSSPSYQYSRHPSGKPGAGVAGSYPKPGSTASSVDGYESFENTNNKISAKFQTWATTDPTTQISLWIWQAWALLMLTRQARSTTGMVLGATTGPRLPHHNTTPIREQASQALEEGDLGDLLRAGQSGECWPTQPISPTLKQAANVLRSKAASSRLPLPTPKPLRHPMATRM